MQRFKVKLIIVTLILFSLCSFIFSMSVMAQQLSLSITPPLLEVVIKPGKSILVAYTIANLGDPAVLRGKVVTFVPLDNKGNIKLLQSADGPIRFSLDNADFQMDEPFFAKTKESRQLLLRIRVPEGAPEGDYYYSMLVESQPAPGIAGTSATQTQGRIGSNILITVTNSGRIDIDGKISSFKTLPGFTVPFFGNKIQLFDSADKIPVQLEVENHGKNVIKPLGQITLTGNFGEKAEYEILPQNILTQSRRILQATPSATLEKALSEPTSLILSGFFLGNYKLSTEIGFGEGAPNIYAQTSFFAFPIKFFIGLIVVLTLAVYLVKKLGK